MIYNLSGLMDVRMLFVRPRYCRICKITSKNNHLPQTIIVTLPTKINKFSTFWDSRVNIVWHNMTDLFTYVSYVYLFKNIPFMYHVFLCCFFKSYSFYININHYIFFSFIYRLLYPVYWVWTVVSYCLLLVLLAVAYLILLIWIYCTYCNYAKNKKFFKKS